MTNEQQKEFNNELVTLLKKYNVNIVPSLGLRLEDVPPVKEETKIEEAKVEEVK